MTRYLIIDDEYIAHDIIKGYCDLLPNMQLAAQCYDAIEALGYLREHQVDLIFLDLNMPKLKGFDFLRTLAAPPKVIVTTAYKEFALEGYELNIVDYLLKPFSFERFLKAVNKAMATNNSHHSIKLDGDQGAERIFLRVNKKYIRLWVKEILCIESSGNYIKIITTKETLSIRAKISDMLATLPKEDFLQVHKSFAVAIRYIDSVEGNRLSLGEHTIPIGKLYKLRVMQLFK
ncbi:MAG: response regulator transcription factor [Bacteroidota bacterium]